MASRSSALAWRMGVQAGSKARHARVGGPVAGSRRAQVSCGRAREGGPAPSSWVTTGRLLTHSGLPSVGPGHRAPAQGFLEDGAQCSQHRDGHGQEAGGPTWSPLQDTRHPDLGPVISSTCVPLSSLKWS